MPFSEGNVYLFYEMSRRCIVYVRSLYHIDRSSRALRVPCNFISEGSERDIYHKADVMGKRCRYIIGKNSVSSATLSIYITS